MRPRTRGLGHLCSEGKHTRTPSSQQPAASAHPCVHPGTRGPSCVSEETRNSKGHTKAARALHTASQLPARWRFGSSFPRFLLARRALQALVSNTSVTGSTARTLSWPPGSSVRAIYVCTTDGTVSPASRPVCTPHLTPFSLSRSLSSAKLPFSGHQQQDNLRARGCRISLERATSSHVPPTSPTKTRHLAMQTRD